MSFRMKGFDKLQKELKKIERNARELDGQHSIPLNELLNDQFMVKFSNFASFQEMLDKSPFKAETPEDFAAIPDNEWDTYVNSNTKFSSWQEMQEKAVDEWTIKKLGL